MTTMSSIDQVLSEPIREDRDRSITYRWVLREVPDLFGGGTGQRCATLYIAHSSHSKELFTTIYPSEVYERHTRSIHSLAGPHWRSPSEAIARYSPKRLEAYAARVLEQFRRDALAGDPAIAALFEVQEPTQ